MTHRKLRYLATIFLYTVPFQTVPAKSYAMATAKFIPTQNIEKTTAVQGYALGFMSLLNKVRESFLIS